MAFVLFKSCIILLFILVVISCIETADKEALIFDRFVGAVLLIPFGMSEKDTCGAWATACPVPESTRGELIKHSLIVEEIYDRGTAASKMKMKVCKESYKVALVFDFTKMNFRFGYGIYYKVRNEEYFRPSNLKHYATPAEITEIMRKYSVRKANYLRGEGFKIMKAAQNDNRVSNDEMWYNGDQKVEFIWIHLFSLKFDFFYKILKKIAYTILQNNKWPVGERCEDYSLGSEVYEETDVKYVDNLYSKENQSQIFQNIKIPKRPCTSDGVCPMKTRCESEKICLSKRLLIPIDQFVFGSSTSPVCSNMATVPIWTDKVEKVLKKLDQYLYAFYRVVDETVLITSGVSGDVLELPIENSWSNKASKIYLDSAKKTIPVPKIIYKVVKYRNRNSPDSQISSVWYSAIIVIHNDPHFSNGRRICYEDVTTEWGWQEITKTANDSNFDNIYVCKYDINILKKLMGLIIAMKQPPSADLNLYKFPSPTKGAKDLDIKQYVDAEFNALSQKGDDHNLRRVKILERGGGKSQDDGDEEIDDGIKVEVESMSR